MTRATTLVALTLTLSLGCSNDYKFNGTIDGEHIVYTPKIFSNDELVIYKKDGRTITEELDGDHIETVIVRQKDGKETTYSCYSEVGKVVTDELQKNVASYKTRMLEANKQKALESIK